MKEPTSKILLAWNWNNNVVTRLPIFDYQLAIIDCRLARLRRIYPIKTILKIGYHYEDLSLVNGDHRQAMRHFEEQLSRLRKIYPVKTICMHGSPLSKHDNRDLWDSLTSALQSAPAYPQPKPHYRDYGIIGEPYFDVDFSKVLYLTDTGRRPSICTNARPGYCRDALPCVSTGGHSYVCTCGRPCVFAGGK